MDPTRLRGPIAPETAEVTADRVAVCRLAPTYAFGIDSRDEALVRSVFTPDAVMQGARGGARADEYIPRLLEGVARDEGTMHNITNHHPALDGDEPDAWSSAVACTSSPPTPATPTCSWACSTGTTP